MSKPEIDKLSVNTFWKFVFKQGWFWVYLCSIWEHSCFYIFPKFLSNIKNWKVCQYLALLHQLNIEKIEVVFITNQSGYLQIKYVTWFQDWVFSFCHLSCFGVRFHWRIKRILMNICLIIICVLNLSKCNCENSKLVSHLNLLLFKWTFSVCWKFGKFVWKLQCFIQCWFWMFSNIESYKKQLVINWSIQYF
jgi:hypothetical protein